MPNNSHATLPHMIVILVVLTLACCSFAYHLIIATSLATLLGANAFWHSISVATYLCGAGVGAYLCSRSAPKDAVPLLYKIELMLTVLGAGTAFSVYLYHFLYRYVFQSAVMEQFGVNTVNDLVVYLDIRAIPFLSFICAVQIYSFAVGYFTGWELPLLLNLVQQRLHRLPPGAVLGMHYIGGVIASVLLCFLLFPHLGLIPISLGFACLNLGICCYLLWLKPRSYGNDKIKLVMVTSLLLLVGLLGEPLTQLQIKTFYHYRHGSMAKADGILDLVTMLENKPDVTRLRSPYQVADIVEISWPGLPPLPTLFLNSHFQFDSRQERFYHETMAHIPIALTHHLPTQVLILGGGDGLLVRELLKYQGHIAKIRLVDIDPMVTQLMNTPLLAGLNEHALEHAKVEVIHDDALRFVREDQQIYNAIYIDMPYPSNYDLSKLYSTEFYQTIAKRLAPNGFIMLDAPMYPVPQEQQLANVQVQSNSIILSTLSHSGFETLKPLSLYGNSFVLGMTSAKTWAKPQKLVTPLYALRQEDVVVLEQQVFPHQIERAYVNSIFRPKLIHLPDLSM